MTVRSKQLGHGYALSAASHDIYTVPVGYRAIVKSILMQNTNVAAQSPNLIVSNGGTAYFNWHENLGASGSATQSIQVDLWLVLNAGDVLSVTPASATLNIIVSGAELQL